MDQDENQKPDLEHKEPSTEESSAEIDIIKQAFESDQETAPAKEDVFSVDLFGEGAQKQEEPASGQVQQPEAGSEAAGAARTAGEPAASAQQPGPVEQQPEPAAGEVHEEHEPPQEPQSSVRVVTDDDIRKLFDASSPGMPPPGGSEGKAKEAAEEEGFATRPVAPPAEPVEPAESAPEEPEQAQPTESTLEKGAEQPSQRSEAEQPLDEELQEISPDEIVEQIETRAEVGDMTAVACGKKGELLQKTAELMDQLEPASEDVMNVAELKKLFRNVDVLSRWAKEITERLCEIEEMLAELKGESK